MKDFGIKEALSTLGLRKNNPGVSTGSTWYRSTGERIESFSPVDGKLIGSVQSGDDKALEKVISRATEAFKRLENMARAETW